MPSNSAPESGASASHDDRRNSAFVADPDKARKIALQLPTSPVAAIRFSRGHLHSHADSSTAQSMILAGHPLPLVYRVYQKRFEPGLGCAVRQDMPVPSFVRTGAWDFAANLREDAPLPFGFKPVPAREATATLGYYLFHHPCETLMPKPGQARKPASGSDCDSVAA